jgi:serine protease Do
VIKIERTNLTPVRIGNSDAIQVGDWAIAIGSPFGFQESVTAGIISAKSRDIPGDSTNFQHFLQTDAAINPGNSGGPLLNINGEVIGINTQIASRSGGYQGIGFAMPMNTAVNVYNQIIKTGKVTRGSIGIQFSANTDHSRDLLKVYGAKNGIFVAHVESGGPADKAGLREQDIITSVNGQKIVTGNDLIDIVASTPIGQSVTVDYIRDGKPMQTHVTIADRAKIFPKEGGLAENGDNDNGSGDQGTQARFGISIQNLNDRMKESMGLKDNGVVVQSVEPGSFAEDMGLIQGDVITAINRRAVTSVDQFKQLQGQLHPGDAVALRVLRNTAQGRGGNAQWQTIYPAGTVPANGQ